MLTVWALSSTKSNVAVYNWSSSTDLHLQVSRVFPNLNVYCSHLALWLASMILRWVGCMAVPWYGRWLFLHPAATGTEGSVGVDWARSQAASSNQDIVYQSLETTPSVAWWCAISYYILKTWLFTMCAKYFWNGDLVLFNYCAFYVVWGNSSMSILMYV